MARAIGIFDSGVGGLTVLRELMRALPQEPTIYLGDNARVPYGALPAERILQYTLECLDYLYGEGVKALVIACNSATTAALEAARRRYDVPVIGVIGATARTAVEVARGRVGIVGTEATVRGEEYVRALRAGNPALEIFQQACPQLALQVEAGELASHKTEVILEGYLQPLRHHAVDTLVLACTHYTFLRPAIERLMGPEVRLVECGPSTVASLVELMDEEKLERAPGGPLVRRLLTTGEVEAFRRAVSTLWPEGLVEIEEVRVEGDHGSVRGQAA